MVWKTLLLELCRKSFLLPHWGQMVNDFSFVMLLNMLEIAGDRINSNGFLVWTKVCFYPMRGPLVKYNTPQVASKSCEKIRGK